MTRPLKFRRPDVHELVLLALVGLVALAPLEVRSTQDQSRFCLSEAIVQGHLSADRCLDNTFDRSVHGGHSYSNKAPGMSVWAVPAVKAVRLPASSGAWPRWGWQLWVVRAATAGLAFLVCVALVAAVASSLSPGTGRPTLIAVGLGTLLTPFAAAGFDHDPTACLGFAAFVLAWQRRPLAAGLTAGAAALTEYEAAAVLLLVGAYVLRGGLQSLARYAAGATPGVLLLALYDWAAFGAPWHNPLSFSANRYREAHQKGLLGIHPPTLHATRLVFVGDRGLLVTSPVLLAAAAGLVLLWRRGLRAEAGVCAAVAAAFVVAECGYFDPYGGVSPGPRFLVPALPFLAVGLGPAFARWRVASTVLAVPSVIATVALTYTWASAIPCRGGLWAAIIHAATDGHRGELFQILEPTVLQYVGLHGRSGGTLLALVAAAAFFLAIRLRSARQCVG